MNRRVHIEFRGIADTIIRKGDRLSYQDSGRIRPLPKSGSGVPKRPPRRP